MIEIDLKINGSTAFEYHADVVPRVGEILDITHEYANGLFKVTDVSHKIFQTGKDNRTRTYVIVKAKSVKSKI